MELTNWLLFLITFSSVLILPGPNAAFVIGQSLKYGFLTALTAPLGFMTATGIHAVIVFSGLGLIVNKYEVIFNAFKWFGVIYLLFLAYKSFIYTPQKILISSKETPILKIYFSALFVSLTNPKALLASLMLYPLFINQEQSFQKQAILISITAMGVSFLIYSLYCLFASILKDKLSNSHWVNKLIGGIYVSAAGVLASE